MQKEVVSQPKKKHKRSVIREMLIKYDYEWFVMMFIFIVFCLYLNWLYTLLVLGILTLILGSLMFDKSFNVIEKEIKELEDGKIR